MSHFTLNPSRNNALRGSLPFRLDYRSTPSPLAEARQDGDKIALSTTLNHSIDHCEGLLGRTARYDDQPEDLNKNPGEVLLLNHRFGRARYDSYVKFNHLQGEGARIESAELECKGRPFFSLTSKNDAVEAKVYNFHSEQEYLINGDIGGRASVTPQ